MMTFAFQCCVLKVSTFVLVRTFQEILVGTIRLVCTQALSAFLDVVNPLLQQSKELLSGAVWDFRFASPEARFSANFSRLGFHQGFGLSVTLPELIGNQASSDMFFTGRRVSGEEAAELGLCDRLVPLTELKDATTLYAQEIAKSAPLAIESIRKTLRGDLADRVEKATLHEASEQARLVKTKDWVEGISASSERRDPDFRRE